MSLEGNEANLEAAAATNDLVGQPGFPIALEDGTIVNVTKEVINGRILLTDSETGDVYADDHLPGGIVLLDEDEVAEAKNGGKDVERGAEADAEVAAAEAASSEYSEADRVANGESAGHGEPVEPVEPVEAVEVNSWSGGPTGYAPVSTPTEPEPTV